MLLLFVPRSLELLVPTNHFTVHGFAFPRLSELGSYSMDGASSPWPLALGRVHLRFLRVSSWLNGSFLFGAESSTVQMDQLLSVLSAFFFFFF